MVKLGKPITKGSLKHQWGRLTKDDLDDISGRRDELVGKIQERYGVNKDQAEKEVEEWLKKVK